MESVFGLPTTTLVPLLMLMIGVVLLIVVGLSLKNRFIFKLSVRDIPRRPAQMALITAGLTFSTVIITTALITGDTLTTSIRSQAIESLGAIDLQLTRPSASVTNPQQLTLAEFDRLKTEAGPAVRAFVPAVAATAALRNPTAGQTESVVRVLGLDLLYDQQIGQIQLETATPATIANLASGEVYLNRYAATLLAANPGDTLELVLNGTTTPITVRQIVADSALLSTKQSVVILPLADAQRLLGLDQAITTILIAGSPDQASGAVAQTLRAKSTNREVATALVALLREPTILNKLETDAAAIPDLQVRLQEQAQGVVSELKGSELNDTLLSYLNDADVAGWILSRDLPAEALATLNTQFISLNEFAIADIKGVAIAEANQAGSQYSQLFLVFGTFSIIAGMLLIIQIFIMLAAQRKSELGITRALGVQRRHVMQWFVTAGLVYGLLAALLGVLIGYGLSRLMVAMLGEQLGSLGDAKALVFTATISSLVIALCLGLLITIIVVVGAAWRISRLNIIEAIRNLSDTPIVRPRGWLRRGWYWLRGPLLIGIGGLLISSAYAAGQVSPVMMGMAAVIIGGGLVLGSLLGLSTLRASLRDRIVFTVIGLGLLLFYGLPFGTWDGILGLAGLESGADVFIIAGVMIVAGAIWLIIYNGDLLLRVFNAVFSRIGSLTPILKTATAYPLSARFRTGMTLAMFAIIIFTVIVMTIITQADQQVLSQKGIETITGGYEIQGVVTNSGTAPPTDLGARIAASSQQPQIASVSSINVAPIEIRQVGATSQRWVSYRANGYDNGYLQQVAGYYGFKLRAPGFETDAQIWQALRERDDVVVLGRSDVPSSQSVRLDTASFMAEGFFWEDDTMPALEVEMRLPNSPNVRRMKVIGVLNSSWIGNFVGGIHSGTGSVNALSDAPIPATMFFIDVREGVDSLAVSQAVEKEFWSQGVETTPMSQLIANSLKESNVFNQLLRGFIALGLFVGIASLGVISTRSVVERRQQIGMLRAIGYQRRMVLGSFLIEAGFIAVLGIVIGTALGLNTGWNIINQFAKEQSNLVFDPPLLDILMIDGLALVFALLATALPAWHASRVYPAEALRYE